MLTYLFQIPFLDIILVSCLITFFIFIVFKFLLKHEIKNIIPIYFTILYGTLLVSTLFYPSVTNGEQFIDTYTNMNYLELIPLKSITDFIVNGNYLQILTGIAIPVPLALLIYFSFEKISIRVISLVSFILILLIEPIQLVINIITKYPNKIIDIDDLILNIIGWAVSICLVNIIDKHLKPFFSRFH